MPIGQKLFGSWRRGAWWQVYRNSGTDTAESENRRMSCNESCLSLCVHVCVSEWFLLLYECSFVNARRDWCVSRTNKRLSWKVTVTHAVLCIWCKFAVSACCAFVSMATNMHPLYAVTVILPVPLDATPEVWGFNSLLNVSPGTRKRSAAQLTPTASALVPIMRQARSTC